jgi:phosphatidylethanolamine/phosphatidyl-N-methylethanolamine N-methyltransferase
MIPENSTCNSCIDCPNCGAAHIQSGYEHVRGHLQKLDENDIRKAYKRWAPVYDAVFGKVIEAGVKQAAARANAFSGKLLEVGVGTGLALRHYGPHLKVTGIDLSTDMLELARKRVKKSSHGNIEALLEMDATSLAFPDNHFDIVVATYVLTVVPDPAKVIHELARVAKPGGTVLIVNHFSVDKGLRGVIEKSLAKHASKLGWRPDFQYDTLLVSERLRLTSIKPVKPSGFFTMLEFRKLD